MKRKQSTRPILLIGTAETSPDFEYSSGFRAPDPAVFLWTSKMGYLVVSALEFGRASRISKHVKAVTPEQLGLGKNKRRQLGHWALALLQWQAVKTVTIPPSFPYGAGQLLKKNGIRVIVAKGALFPSRAVKTDAEVRKIRESQQAAVIALRSAVAMIAASSIEENGGLRSKGEILTSEMVQRTIARVLLDHNCFSRETIVACGNQGADPHEKGHGPLAAGEPVVIDIFPQHLDHGYWGDLTRTVVRGIATAQTKKMYRAVRAAQYAALAKIRPGVKCSTVHGCAVTEFERRGFRTETIDSRCMGFIHSTGHGVGLAIHEEPALGQTDKRLRTGHVVTVEPGLYYPDIGGIRIEDTIVVTKTGWRYLVPCEKKLEV
ncbi:MAG: aminopeptidase P family protein [Deltaproteobacteria bacterium]|nr:aminopeptidase P family protein [Deltaproteobacteria bacterium]